MVQEVLVEVYVQLLQGEVQPLYAVRGDLPLVRYIVVQVDLEEVGLLVSRVLGIMGFLLLHHATVVVLMSVEALLKVKCLPRPYHHREGMHGHVVNLEVHYPEIELPMRLLHAALPLALSEHEYLHIV
jgi:hypothetical protein